MTILYIVLQLLSIIGLLCGVLMLWSPKKPPRTTSNTLPFVSIIIPARNEAQRISPLLQSLRMQNWQHFEVIVVDDGSTDNTSEVAASFGAKAIKGQQVGNMPAGKSNACAYGATKANGELLLFLDADVQLVDEHSLQRIIQSFEPQQKGILSLQPYHVPKRLYENLSVVFNIIVLTGMNVFTAWRNRFKTAGSFGPCILCDRESYVATGGHEAAEESIMDDFALSDVFVAKQLPVTNYVGQGVMNMRMYEEGVGQLIEGWTKNLATASQSTHPFVMTLIQGWIFGVIVVTLAPVVALFTQPLWVFVSVGMYVLYGVHVYMLARRAGSFHIAVIVLYPLFVLFFTAIFLYSLYCTHVRHSVTWRGRKINV